MTGPDRATRVYQYGAVPLGRFPEAGMDALWKANRLWNNLVEIHNDNAEDLERARRDADAEYARIREELDDLEERIEKAYEDKRTARMEARTRSSSHSLIAKANAGIAALKEERKRLWDDTRPLRARVDKRVDKPALNAAFKERVGLAQRVENTGGLDSVTANEVARNFREARARVFKTPRARLRFHRFDGAGYRFYRFRDRTLDDAADGVPFDYFSRKGEGDDRAFTLEPAAPRPDGVPRWRLRAKIAGGQAGAGKVYAHFDLVMHRPLPEGAQINNAKLMRKRVGDRFKYTVNFSVRVPAAEPAGRREDAIGVDIGFRRMPGDAIRAAAIGGTSDAFGFRSVELPKDFMRRVDRVEDLQTRLDETAGLLGRALKPLLKGGAVLPEDHRRHKMLRSVATLPANRAMSFEKAYKLADWFGKEPDTLPTAIQEKLMDWRDRNARSYREMHNLRKKTLGWRKELYRVVASELVAHGLPIGVEKLDLRVFAEARDRDNDLSDGARGQRFLVSPSELLAAIRNAAGREGVPVFEVPPRDTSRRCGACGDVNENLGSDLEWRCPSCGAAHDRDRNAAVNIARAARKMALDATEGA